jgi:cobalt-zinc-cadmium efflux system outer membrane protein
MRRTHTIVLLLPLLVGAQVAAAQAPLTRVSLEEAVNLATRQNHTLRAKAFEAEGVRAGEITAGLPPNPGLSFLADQYGGGSQNPVEYAVTISQTLELGGKRQRRLDSARAATRVAGFDLAEVRRQIVFQTQSAFVGVQAAKAALALAEQNVKTMEDVERVQRFRAERGDISELELVRIQVQQFTFQRDELEARQALRSAKIALRALAGPDRIAEEFDVVGELAFHDVSYPGPDLVGLALANRPDVKAAEAAREKARADVNLARANAAWDLTPLVEYKRIGADNTAGFGFSVPIRLFDRNQGEIARTQVEADRVEETRRALLVQIRAEVGTALAAVEGQRQKVLALRDTYLPKAQQARETVAFAYRRGGLTVLDFLDAQRSYRETALNYIQSLGAYWAAVYQLEAAVGTSLER